MANMAQYLADELLNLFRHTNAAASPTTLYLALMTSLSTLATAGTEITGGSYGRASITSGSVWSAPATATDGSRYIVNSTDIVFTAASADWGYIKGWELRDASSSGNRYAFGEFDTAQFVASGKQFKVLAGELVIKVA